MIGAIAGDIIGSRYEFRLNRMKQTDFRLFHPKSKFTDDTILTVAIAESLLYEIPYEESLKTWGNRYLNAGYGRNFKKWLKGEMTGPYGSYGNGSAMRVSPCGYLKTLEDALEEAEKSAMPTHNHPEGIKGAQSVAAAIFLSRNGSSKDDIKEYIENQFEYDLSRTPDDIRPNYKFDVSCQGSVPEAIICFLHSNDYEEAVRLAVSLGGDTDTQAAIAGSIAEAFYQGIPDHVLHSTIPYLPDEVLDVVEQFNKRFNPSHKLVLS